MSADPRADLRAKIAEKLDGNLGSIDMAVDAVMSLFAMVSQRTEEYETTTWGDRYERFVWSRLIVAEVAIESGSYEGKLRG